MNTDDDNRKEGKQQCLAQIHERNQQFLQSPHNSETSGENSSDKIHLNHKIVELQRQVRQLTHELQTTRDTYQLSSDKARAEIAMLQEQIETQNSRHESITSSLRDRLVESELARIKMQNQLVASMEKKATGKEKIKGTWIQISSRIVEENKWVEEQINHWKESMEDRRRIVQGAKMRVETGVVADLDEGAENDFEGVEGGERSAIQRRRSIQRRLWGGEDHTNE